MLPSIHFYFLLFIITRRVVYCASWDGILASTYLVTGMYLHIRDQIHISRCISFGVVDVIDPPWLLSAYLSRSCLPGGICMSDTVVAHIPWYQVTVQCSLGRICMTRLLHNISQRQPYDLDYLDRDRPNACIRLLVRGAHHILVWAYRGHSPSIAAARSGHVKVWWWIPGIWY